MDKSLAAVDWELADFAADRILLAYALAESLNDYAGQSPNRRVNAITIAHVTTAFQLLDLGLDDRKASAEFAKVFRSVRRTVKRLGNDARLRDVLAEMHLEQGK